MSESGGRQFAVGVSVLAAATVTFSVWIGAKRRAILSDSKTSCKAESLPVDCEWLSQGSFDVLTAICDAFIPAIKPVELTSEKVHDSIDSIHPLLRADAVQFTDAYIAENKDFLCRGALDLKVHLAATEAIGKLITAEERFQLSLMLKLLSTSAGSFMVTGFPVAFQYLPLYHRVKALENLRDCSIAPLRVFYQTLKRVTGNLFFSFVEHGAGNANWKSVGYDPAETVGKGPLQTLMERTAAKELDTFLRQKLRYQNVKKALLPANAKNTDDNSNDTDVLEVDVVIVGSGCGGGIMAAQLAQAGLSVLVLEKGGYFRTEEFKQWRECEAFLHTFEKGGLCSTVEGNLLVLAGSCVGGGSTINWSASFRTPEVVRQDWAAMGLQQFEPGGAYDESQDAVHGLVNVNSDNSFRTATEQKQCIDSNNNSSSSSSNCDGVKPPFVVNGNNTMLWEGAEKLGFRPEKIPRNVKDCVDCGHCCHGCPYESKQSTPTALLEPLLLSGTPHGGTCKGAGPAYKLQVIPHCHVSRVLYEDVSGEVKDAAGVSHSCRKRATGVEATVQVFEDDFSTLSVGERLKRIEKAKYHTKKLLVKAKVVVSAAGALHTPALLLRSQLSHSGMVGAHLTLHPVLGAGGVFPDYETKLASGVSMGVVVRDPIVSNATYFDTSSSTMAQRSLSAEQVQEENKYRIASETPPAHVGLMGLLFPWISTTHTADTSGFSGFGGGLAVKVGMLHWKNSATFIALPRDRSQSHNRVTIDGEGHPVLHYVVTPPDADLILIGLEMNLRYLRSAGARFLYIAHENFPWHFCGSMGPQDDESARFETFLASVRSEGIHTARMQIFSAHQMSSCRMAPTPETGPTSPSGELYECANLFVADASVMPTSLGINPMVTIESLSHMISKSILRKLSQEYPLLQQQMRDFAKKCDGEHQW